ncbi:MAG: hypothetical protein ACR2HX_04430 [Pyrinomonadaceae bacterium]
MLNQSPLLRILAAGFAVVFMLSCASTYLAQSGRQVRKSTPPPVSTPEPTPTPGPKASSEKPKPRLTFVIGLDRYTGFANVPSYAYEGVLRSLADRLAEPQGIHVVVSQDGMHRSDAIRKAKAEKEGYVVWLELQVDTVSGGSQNTENRNNIVIEYSVFAPTTAKRTTSGRTYSRSQRNKSIIPVPRTSSIYGDRYLNQAAEEAADRILAHFHIRTAPIRLP